MCPCLTHSLRSRVPVLGRRRIRIRCCGYRLRQRILGNIRRIGRNIINKAESGIYRLLSFGNRDGLVLYLTGNGYSAYFLFLVDRVIRADTGQIVVEQLDGNIDLAAALEYRRGKTYLVAAEYKHT